MTRQEKLAVACQTATEGMVLLKNENGTLPLKSSDTVALFGLCSYFCHRMGVGSGDVIAAKPVQICEGLSKAGFAPDSATAEFYANFIASKKDYFDRVNRDWAQWSYSYPEPDIAEAAVSAAATRCNLAIVTIGRNGGEDGDLKDGTGSLHLSDAEEALLRKVCSAFPRVVLLLNVCGVMDLSYLEIYSNIVAVLYTGLAAETTGLAVARLLSGADSPSGKLTTTWAYRYRDYPTTDCFGTMEVPFHEGIYVGYRYFDTFDVKPRYAFGFGLSYTTFKIEYVGTTISRSHVCVRAKVTNTGTTAGAQVVQLYISEPDGRLEKAYQQLAAYAKTAVLEPETSEEVALEFDLRDLAAWCSVCSTYILESGDYTLRLGDSSRNTSIVAKIELLDPVKTLKSVKCMSTDETQLGLISKAGHVSYMYEGESKESDAAERFTLVPEDFDCAVVRDSAEVCATEELPRPAEGTPLVKFGDVMAGKATVEDLVAQFSDFELSCMVNGAVSEELKNLTVGGNVRGKVYGEAGEFWSSEKYGIPPFTCADGPSGLRLTIFGQETGFETEAARAVVGYPCGTLVAQTWNKALARKFGECICSDMEVADIDGWLAPGINLHRNPLCGRNFEYFSEDPLVSGLTGAAIVRGVQESADGKSTGRYATIKHYAVNSQEYERRNEDNLLSERALREIYLRSFCYAVREGKPKAVMTSYNKFNGEHTATNFDLLQTVLRCEFGFDGFVMTDWWSAADLLRHHECGNDLLMPGVASMRERIANAITKGDVSRAAVQLCAVRILNCVACCLSARS